MGKKSSFPLSHSPDNKLNETANRPVLLLSAAQVRTLLQPDTCLAALKTMYQGLHECPADKGSSLGFHARDGKIHVKAGLPPKTHTYFAAKINANFLENPARHALPTIQGLIVLSSGENGQPLAVLQSGVLTGIRTAAASALAAQYGANPGAKTLGIVGCGAQAPYQVAAMLGVRGIKQVFVFDIDHDKATLFAEKIHVELRVQAVQVDKIEGAVRGVDICITCTSSSKPIVNATMLTPGSFLAAVGADNPDKQEIDPDVFRVARLIVDDVEQCAVSGDLAHALKAGVMCRPDATLAELASGAASVRQSEEDIVVFDSTGVGVQDVAAASAVYELACAEGVGTPILMEE